jgi:hypothetical protein
MILRLLVATCLAIACLATQDTMALDLVSIDQHEVIVCPVKTGSETPPQFTEADCETVSAWQIDPQNTALWVKAHVTIPDSMRNDKQPHSVFVFGKTSSRVYFNGSLVGQNGTPSLLAQDEFPGKIDAMFYIPPALIQQGINEITLKLSSHHGFLSLGRPISFIGFGSYNTPTYAFQKTIGLSLIPLGALVLGGLYFLVAGFSPLNRQTNLLFLLMSMLAACQLFAEISRALFSYSYPLHDVRLLLIVSLSVCFGACLLRYITLKLELKRAWLWTLAGVANTILAVVLIPGFDSKTTMAILIPTSLCTVFIGYQLFKQPGRELIAYFGVFLIFMFIVLVNLSTFHDILFYYVITGILCFLFVQQALKLNREQMQREEEQAQVAKLQFRLEQNHQKNAPQKISINSAGKIDLIASEQIAFCKAAGDYVELYLQDKKQILFSGNLKELERQLPSTFLRVHRSYLVNMDFIQSLSNKSTDLQKSPAGGGFLKLAGGFEVPVSRRIMPMVRSAIQ